MLIDNLDRHQIRSPAPDAGQHRSRRLTALGLVFAVVLAVLGLWPTGLPSRLAPTFLLLNRGSDAQHDYLDATGWPRQGQAAYQLDGGLVHAGPGQQPQPIASLAKVMTAYLTLRTFQLAEGTDGFTLTVTDADVADTAGRRSRDESVVAVRSGETLTERQALAAILLPSANNVAAMLARRVAGSEPAFVEAMNRTAGQLGMAATRYTDPSGLDAGTRSTAADQLLLADQAMRLPAFGELVSLTSYPLPVAGTVHNTDVLLGQDGFVGIKTGSDDAAGGCFMFRSHRLVAGQPHDITGVVLGQPGSSLAALARTGQYAARQLVDRIAT